jgi:hypothetical protein
VAVLDPVPEPEPESIEGDPLEEEEKPEPPPRPPRLEEDEEEEEPGSQTDSHKEGPEEADAESVAAYETSESTE